MNVDDDVDHLTEEEEDVVVEEDEMRVRMHGLQIQTQPGLIKPTDHNQEIMVNIPGSSGGSYSGPHHRKKGPSPPNTQPFPPF